MAGKTLYDKLWRSNLVPGESDDSQGAFGVLVAQTPVQEKSKAMQIKVEGKLGAGVTAKDVALAIIGRIGAAGGTGYCIEFAGSAIRGLSMEGRMTVCNLAIEAGACAGIIAADETTFEYLKGRKHAPQGADWDRAVEYWKTLHSDADARFDTVIEMKAEEIEPHVSWAISPGQVLAVGGKVRAAIKRAKLWSWLALFAASFLIAWLLQRFTFPAAFLVGPMLVSLLFSLRGMSLTLPRKCFWGAQALTGCIVARAITASVVSSIAQDWPSMLLTVSTTVIAGGIVGWVVMKSRALPGSTAAWGAAPGGASAMISMAESYGADIRLVAFMQYLRVLMVVMSASVATHFLQGDVTAGLNPTTVIPEQSSSHVWSTTGALALAACGGWIGYRLRIPAGIMLVPMLAGAALQAGGGLNFALPDWLQAFTYMVLGWYVGLGFDRSILRYAIRAFPILLLATFLLIALCAGSAWMLIHVLYTDPLTAFLATSPGGLDSIAIIAMGTQADIPFVLAVQTLRLFMVILTGPWIAKLICRYA